MLPWVLCGIFMLFLFILIVKIITLQNGLKNIQAQFEKHLAADTNTLITTDSNDRQIKKLTAAINTQLRLLRKKRRRYEIGDLELKEAVTNISHDLRTPLTAISGYIELLEQESQTETTAHYIDTIKNRTEAMKQLIEELFHYSIITSTPENMHVERISLNTALEESIVAFYSAFIVKHIEPNIIMPNESIECLVDKTILSRILENLLSNAIKYSDGDLDITLSTDGTITFTNTASSLDQIQVEKLFNRFYTVESARHSTGLGLSIVKSLVEQMKGEITAQLANNRLMIELTFPQS